MGVRNAACYDFNANRAWEMKLSAGLHFEELLFFAEGDHFTNGSR